MINNSSVDNAATNGARTIEAIACVCLEDDYYSATSGADMTDPIATIPIPTEDQTATTATDEVLLTALQNRQDRFFLLKLEREYCNFIEDPSKDVLEYPFLNSYFRMMIHRSAIYYQLARSVDVVQRKIRLTKTEHSAIPSLRFQELVEEEEDTTPVKSFKVLKRSPNRPVSACEARGTPLDNTQVSLLRSSSSVPTKSSLQLPSNTSENSHNRRTRSLEQREAAYAIARAQIFDTGVEVEDKAEEHSQEYSKPQNSPILSQSLNQGQTKTKNDIVRRTSTGSSVSSSSSSSGTTLADVNTGGVWMTAAGNNGNIDCISSNDAQNDYAIRNVITSSMD
ncbi:hypothetical protein FBU30_006461 [Linnemannia zychae]|nr:hypothetical protein FBU30_006461 [Linnemannia zychae]